MVTTETDLTFSTGQAASLAGVTYRMLDHWLRLGIIHLTASSDTPGSGGRRRFTAAEVDALCRMVERYKAAVAVITQFRDGALWTEEIG